MIAVESIKIDPTECKDKKCKWYPYHHAISFHWVADSNKYYRDGRIKEEFLTNNNSSKGR